MFHDDEEEEEEIKKYKSMVTFKSTTPVSNLMKIRLAVVK
jgi:hypothetical protein